MYKPSEETMKNNNEALIKNLGISYQEFEKLDYDEYQKLILEHKKKNHKRSSKKLIPVMIGTGEHSTFIYVKKGERVMIDDGSFIVAGMTLEEERKELEKGLKESPKEKILSLFKRN